MCLQLHQRLVYPSPTALWGEPMRCWSDIETGESGGIHQQVMCYEQTVRCESLKYFCWMLLFNLLTLKKSFKTDLPADTLDCREVAMQGVGSHHLSFPISLSLVDYDYVRTQAQSDSNHDSLVAEPWHADTMRVFTRQRPPPRSGWRLSAPAVVGGVSHLLTREE